MNQTIATKATPAALLPLTHAALCHWPRWRDAGETGRRAIAERLRPEEAEALTRWGAALQAAGDPKGWFRDCNRVSEGLRVEGEVVTTLLRGLRVQAKGLPDLLRASGVARGGPLGGERVLEAALRERLRDGWIWGEESEEMNTSNGAVAERTRDEMMADVRRLLDGWQAAGVNLKTLTGEHYAQLMATGASAPMIRGAIGGRLQTGAKKAKPAQPELTGTRQPVELQWQTRAEALEKQVARLREELRRMDTLCANLVAGEPEAASEEDWEHSLWALVTRLKTERDVALASKAAIVEQLHKQTNQSASLGQHIDSAHHYLDQAGVEQTGDCDEPLSLMTRIDRLAGTLETRLRRQIADERIPNEVPELDDRRLLLHAGKLLLTGAGSMEERLGAQLIARAVA